MTDYVNLKSILPKSYNKLNKKFWHTTKIFTLTRYYSILTPLYIWQTTQYCSKWREYWPRTSAHSQREGQAVTCFPSRGQVYEEGGGVHPGWKGEIPTRTTTRREWPLRSPGRAKSKFERCGEKWVLRSLHEKGSKSASKPHFTFRIFCKRQKELVFKGKTLVWWVGLWWYSCWVAIPDQLSSGRSRAVHNNNEDNNSDGMVTQISRSTCLCGGVASKVSSETLKRRVAQTSAYSQD